LYIIQLAPPISTVLRPYRLADEIHRQFVVAADVLQHLYRGAQTAQPG
jgi:hypothetical protein